MNYVTGATGDTSRIKDTNKLDNKTVHIAALRYGDHTPNESRQMSEGISNMRIQLNITIFFRNFFHIFIAVTFAVWRQIPDFLPKYIQEPTEFMIHKSE